MECRQDYMSISGHRCRPVYKALLCTAGASYGSMHVAQLLTHVCPVDMCLDCTPQASTC
jgi:hypothetical protein